MEFDLHPQGTLQLLELMIVDLLSLQLIQALLDLGLLQIGWLHGRQLINGCHVLNAFNATASLIAVQKSSLLVPEHQMRLLQLQVLLLLRPKVQGFQFLRHHHHHRLQQHLLWVVQLLVQ